VHEAPLVLRRYRHPSNTRLRRSCDGVKDFVFATDFATPQTQPLLHSTSFNTDFCFAA